MSGVLSSISFGGRANRHDLLVISLALTAAEVIRHLAPLPTLAGQALSGVILWIGLATLARRLHDIGLSGWWLLAGVAFSFGWTALVVIAVLVTLGLPALTPGNALYPVSLGLAFLAPLGALVWLHLKPGQFGVNRFGPPRPVSEVEVPAGGRTAT